MAHHTTTLRPFAAPAAVLAALSLLLGWIMWAPVAEPPPDAVDSASLSSIAERVARLAKDGRPRPLGSPAARAFHRALAAEAQTLGARVVEHEPTWRCSETGVCAKVGLTYVEPPGLADDVPRVLVVVPTGSSGSGAAVSQSIVPAAVALQLLADPPGPFRIAFVDGAGEPLALEPLLGWLHGTAPSAPNPGGPKASAAVFLHGLGVDGAATLTRARGEGVRAAALASSTVALVGDAAGELMAGRKGERALDVLHGGGLPVVPVVPVVEVTWLGGAGLHDTPGDSLAVWNQRTAGSALAQTRAAIDALARPAERSATRVVSLGTGGVIAWPPVAIWGLWGATGLLLALMGWRYRPRPGLVLRAAGAAALGVLLAFIATGFLAWSIKAPLAMPDLGAVRALPARWAIWMFTLAVCVGTVTWIQRRPLSVEAARASKGPPASGATATWLGGWTFAWLAAAGASWLAPGLGAAWTLAAAGGIAVGQFGLAPGPAAGQALLRRHSARAAAVVLSWVWTTGIALAIARQAELVWSLSIVPLLSILVAWWAVGIASGLVLLRPLAPASLPTAVAVGALCLAAAATVWTLFSSPFTPQTPRRLNVLHVQNEDTHAAVWVTVDPFQTAVPPAMFDVVDLSGGVDAVPPWLPVPAKHPERVVRSAPAPTVGGEAAKVSVSTSGSGRWTLTMQPARSSDRLAIFVPPESADVQVERVQSQPAHLASWRGSTGEWRGLSVLNPDNQPVVVELIAPPTLDGPRTIVVAAGWFGLPPEGAALRDARNQGGMAFGEGDRSWVTQELTLQPTDR